MKEINEVKTVQPEVMDRVMNKLPEPEIVNQLSNFIKVLADATRIKMIWILEENEMCVNDLAVALNMTQSAVSHQLKTLKDANVVKSKKEGKNVFYSLSDDHVKDIFLKTLEHIQE
ncbi:ArsR/SmtB family transcription factor [Carnobacterium gallinarum]|uniref:ArsR/SmtB family transcription factor n=1 Tax=Carnobacterium gallinarum TaxID=2749 RepID=UPI0005587E37|nr:metalloregulator ArsR/SmtB family transcription factor [Carnobacterium gallinarum]